MTKKLMAVLALALMLTMICSAALAVGGDLTVKEAVAYSDKALTKPISKIPAGTSLLADVNGSTAKVYYGGQVCYVGASDLMKKDASSDYFATLEKGTRVYQRAETGASSFKLKSSGTVKLCLVNGDWALVRTTGKLALYAYVKLDKLVDVRK